MRGRKPSLLVVEGASARPHGGGLRPTPPNLRSGAGLGRVQSRALVRRCPPAPAWLSSHAKTEWKRAAPDLVQRAVLTPETQSSLEAYCTATGTVRELEEVMVKEGRLMKDADGKATAPHPAFKMQQSAMREARLLAAELGLSACRRTAKAPPGKEGDGDGWDADLLP